jgi:hypothetical protein
MEDYAHYEWRSLQQRSNLFIVKTFVIAENKHLAGGLSESRYSLANERLKFAVGVDGLGVVIGAGKSVDFALVERHSSGSRATAQQIE